MVFATHTPRKYFPRSFGRAPAADDYQDYARLDYILSSGRIRNGSYGKEERSNTVMPAYESRPCMHPKLNGEGDRNLAHYRCISDTDLSVSRFEIVSKWNFSEAQVASTHTQSG